MTDIQLTAEQAAALPELAEALKQGPVTVSVKEERWEPKEADYLASPDGVTDANGRAFIRRYPAFERMHFDHAEELARMIRWTAITHAFRCEKAPDYVVPTPALVISGTSEPTYFVATSMLNGETYADAYRGGDARDPGRTYMPLDVAEEFCRLYNLGLIGGLCDD